MGNTFKFDKPEINIIVAYTGVTTQDMSPCIFDDLWPVLDNVLFESSIKSTVYPLQYGNRVGTEYATEFSPAIVTMPARLGYLDDAKTIKDLQALKADWIILCDDEARMVLNRQALIGCRAIGTKYISIFRPNVNDTDVTSLLAKESSSDCLINFNLMTRVVSNSEPSLVLQSWAPDDVVDAILNDKQKWKMPDFIVSANIV